MFHLSYHHADKINPLPYRIPLAIENVMSWVFRVLRTNVLRTFQCVYGAAGDVSNPVLVWQWVNSHVQCVTNAWTPSFLCAWILKSASKVRSSTVTKILFSANFQIFSISIGAAVVPVSMLNVLSLACVQLTCFGSTTSTNGSTKATFLIQLISNWYTSSHQWIFSS